MRTLQYSFSCESSLVTAVIPSYTTTELYNGLCLKVTIPCDARSANTSSENSLYNLMLSDTGILVLPMFTCIDALNAPYAR